MLLLGAKIFNIHMQFFFPYCIKNKPCTLMYSVFSDCLCANQIAFLQNVFLQVNLMFSTNVQHYKTFLFSIRFPRSGTCYKSLQNKLWLATGMKETRTLINNPSEKLCYGMNMIRNTSNTLMYRSGIMETILKYLKLNIE